MTADDAGAQHDGSDAGDRGDAGNGGQGEKTFTQSQLTAILDRKTREIESKYEGFDELKAKAADFDAAAGERDSLKSDNDRLTAQLLRQKISATQGLDPELWDRVQGVTAEEIEADVKKLVEKFTVVPKRNGAFRSGASAPDGASGKQRAAAALRGMRRD